MQLRKPMNLRTPIQTAQANFRARSSFSLPLQNSLQPERAFGSATPSFSRTDGADGRATFTDFEGRIVPVKAGEARFMGARRVENLIQGSSEDLTVAPWSLNGAASRTATTVTFTSGATDQLTQIVKAAPFMGVVRTILCVATISASSGTKTFKLRLTESSVVDSDSGDLTATTTPQIFTWTMVGNNANAGSYLAIAFRQGSTPAAGTLNISKVAVYDVTGATDSAPGPYVSVGVLSTPYNQTLTANGVAYDTSATGVDGVAYSRFLNANTVSSNVVTEAVGAPISSSTAKFAQVPGALNSYYSSPDSAAASITGDLDIRVNLAPVSWTGGGAEQSLVAKAVPAGNQKSYILAINATGQLRTYISGNGSTYGLVGGLSSSAAIPFSAGTAGWVRMAFAVATGFLNYYTSVDGVTWTQLGNANLAGTAGAIFDSTAPIEISGYEVQTAAPLNGRIYRAQIYNTIGGTTPVVDFNPNLSTSAQTFTAATGEVWTTNGNARIYGNTHATYGIPAQWDASGPYGYLSEGSRVNTALNSKLISVWTPTNVTLSDNQYVAPDGTTTMGKVLANAGSAQHYAVYPAGAATSAGSTTFSYFLRYVNNRWCVLWLSDKVTTFQQSFDLLNGVVGASSAGVTATIKPTATANVWRVTMTMTTAASAIPDLYIGINNADSASVLTWNAAGTEAVGVWLDQVEVGAFASTPIPTTTAAVTRAADSLTYASAGNVNSTTGSWYAEITAATNVGEILSTYPDGAGGAFGGSSGKLGLYDGTAWREGDAWTASTTTVLRTAVTYGGTTAKTYQNGVASSALTFDGSINANTSLAIGTYTNGAAGSQLFGTIRNVKIWTRALSDGQIAAI